MEELVFDLRLKEKPVKVTTTKGASAVYKLRELSAEQRDDYLSRFKDRMEIVNGEAKGVKDTKGLQIEFLAMCLYDEADHLIPMAEIQKFPCSALVGLYKAAQVLSGFGEAGVAAAKND